MEKFNKYIDKIIFTLIAISFIILILSCVLQVFTRFILNNSLSGLIFWELFFVQKKELMQ